MNRDCGGRGSSDASRNSSGNQEQGYGYVNVQTIRENYKGYTKPEVLKAREAHHTQGLI
jgi:hypothetical protein